jgi:SNF2 family DNA or RNA helicase
MAIQIDVAGDQLKLVVPWQLNEQVKRLPGVRYNQAQRAWLCPRTWQHMVLLAREFKNPTLSEAAQRWFEEEQAWIERIELAKVDGQGAEALWPFQRNGVNFLAAAGKALLADEPGTGKTVQVICTLRRLGRRSLPALVVCPLSMVFQWKAEFEKWWPEVSVGVVVGTPAQRKKVLESQFDVYIIHWEGLRLHSRLAPYGSLTLKDHERKPKELDAIEWRTVVADEAHRAKSPKAAQTRAWWRQAHRAKYRFALTGTPVANNPADLWSILYGIDPEAWPSRTRWIDRYCNVIVNFSGYTEICGLKKENEAELHQLMSPTFLRRRKADVLPDLPPKVYVTRPVLMEPAQQRLYKALLRRMIGELESGTMIVTDPLALLARLSQVAAAMPVLDLNGEVIQLTRPSCKVDAMFELLEESDEPTVFFAHSRKLIELCAEEVSKAGYNPALLTGAVTGNFRQEMIEQFQRGETDIFLATLGAGGEGVTLTRATRLVFLQRSWSLVQRQQAEDRIHRIGQQHQVEIVNVITKDTIEEKIVDALLSKEAQLRQVVQDPAWWRSLDPES